jgi:hypothetical protein
LQQQAGIEALLLGELAAYAAPTRAMPAIRPTSVFRFMIFSVFKVLVVLTSGQHARGVTTRTEAHEVRKNPDRVRRYQSAARESQAV